MPIMIGVRGVDELDVVMENGYAYKGALHLYSTKLDVMEYDLPDDCET